MQFCLPELLGCRKVAFENKESRTEAAWKIFDEIFYVMIFMHTPYFQLGTPATIMLAYSFMQGSNGCVLV